MLLFLWQKNKQEVQAQYDYICWMENNNSKVGLNGSNSNNNNHCINTNPFNKCSNRSVA